ncbi:uncharacterized protein METZ01_LOCUS505371, partial [marine metagenome]
MAEEPVCPLAKPSPINSCPAAIRTGSLEIDLGEEKTFQSVYLASGWKRDPQYAARNFDLEAKIDGEWKVLPGGKVRENSDWIVPFVFDKPMKASKVRILFKDDDFNRVYELAVFAGKPEIARPESSSNLHNARVCR